MKPTAELFDLIKSLSPNEKRYFKLNVALQKGNKNYLELFAALDSQKIFNEVEIKTKYKKENFVKNLTFTKNYLYKLIFKSLNSYYNEKSIDAKLNNVLTRCRLMFNKALFPEYFKSVKYGLELSRKYERFTSLLEFLELERQLTKKEDIPKKNIFEIYDEEINVLDKIKNNNKYKRAISGLFKIYRMEGIVRNKFTDRRVDEILSAEEFKNAGMALSVTAKEKYFFALNIANELKGNPDKAYFFNKKRFEYISMNKEIFQQFLFDNFKDSFTALIISAAHAGKFNEAEKLIEKYKKLIKKSELKDIDNILVFYIITIAHAIFRQEKKTEITDTIEKFLIQYKGKITINHYNYLYYLLAKYFFVIGKFGDSLRMVNLLFEIRTLKFTIHIEPYARMLNLLIHYELGNHKLLHYLIPSTAKYFKSKNKLFKVESTVLNFLKKVNRLHNEKDIQKNFLLLRDEFMILKKDKYEKNAFVYFDFLNWIDKKINQLKAY
ncbi:MAG: hypothetical protein M3R36_08820 [Bacteroidota bacterium]|nr:hypothetical protein [Bacteroidota bacterium]